MGVYKLSASGGLKTGRATYANMLAGNSAYVDPPFDFLASSIITSNISSVLFDVSPYAALGYKHLQFRILARTNASAIVDDVMLRFNSDSTSSNYYYHGLYGTSTVAGSENGNSVSGTRIAQAAAVNSETNAFFPAISDLNDVFSTVKNKSIRTQSGSSGTHARNFLASNLWMSTAAVTSISLVPYLGTAFVPGSRFSLYGIRG